MTVATVDDLLARDRRDERTVLIDATGRSFDAHWFCTTSWKAGNFLRHAGVREGVTVGVVGEGPLALFAFLGTTLLEDGPDSVPDGPRGRRRVPGARRPSRRPRVRPVRPPAGAQRVGYGDAPAKEFITSTPASGRNPPSRRCRSIPTPRS